MEGREMKCSEAITTLAWLIKPLSQSLLPQFESLDLISLGVTGFPGATTVVRRLVNVIYFIILHHKFNEDFTGFGHVLRCCKLNRRVTTRIDELGQLKLTLCRV